MRDIILTRVELYELLWQEPMRTVASDLGLSDVGLAKRCKKALSYRAAVRPVTLRHPAALRTSQAIHGLSFAGATAH